MGKEALSFSKPPFRGPYQDPPSGRPHWSNWFLADLLPPQASKAGVPDGGWRSPSLCGLGSRNASTRRPFLEETPVFTVCFHPGPWNDSSLSLLRALGASAVSFAGAPASDVSGICRRPSNRCVYTWALPGCWWWSAGVALRNPPPRGGAAESRDPLTHSSILYIYSPNVSEPYSVPVTVLSMEFHR